MPLSFATLIVSHGSHGTLNGPPPRREPRDRPPRANTCGHDRASGGESSLSALLRRQPPRAPDPSLGPLDDQCPERREQIFLKRECLVVLGAGLIAFKGKAARGSATAGNIGCGPGADDLSSLGRPSAGVIFGPCRSTALGVEGGDRPRSRVDERAGEVCELGQPVESGVDQQSYPQIPGARPQDAQEDAGR